MIAPLRPRPSEELRRSRRELARARRDPLRIVIASDPLRPMRTLVMPRNLPAVLASLAGALLLLTAGLAVTSWRMSDSIDQLQGRVSAMSQAADDVAQHPLSDLAMGGARPASARAHGRRRASGQTGGNRFTIESVNTGEEVELTVDAATGELDGASYRELRRLMRCMRTGAETPIDPRLVELLQRIAERTGQKILLVSGFRAPIYSTATLSYHVRGMAADIRIPGMTPLMVRDLVRSLGVQGIGYYPVSQFVHVDLRDERYHWTDHGHSRQDDDGS